MKASPECDYVIVDLGRMSDNYKRLQISPDQDPSSYITMDGEKVDITIGKARNIGVKFFIMSDGKKQYVVQVNEIFLDNRFPLKGDGQYSYTGKRGNPSALCYFRREDTNKAAELLLAIINKNPGQSQELNRIYSRYF